jgi:putative heme iron utilization protein
MSEAAERAERIRAAVAAEPGEMTLRLASRLGVPEVEVIRALPDGRAVELDLARWRELFGELAGLGEVHVIVSNAAATCETTGTFGGFSDFEEFFNVQSGSLDLHIRPARLGAVFAVRKPSHLTGVATLSVQFFDLHGDAAMKVFLNFGGKPSPQRLAWFDDVTRRFRRDAKPD